MVGTIPDEPDNLTMQVFQWNLTVIAAVQTGA